jgi:hypothetical protein
MNVDLHAHFPMHLDPAARGGAVRAMTAPRQNEEDAMRALILEFACRMANYRSLDSGPAVTVKSLRAGKVGVALSVLYCPFAEMDLDRAYGAPPRPEYFTQLVALARSIAPPGPVERTGARAHVAADPPVVEASPPGRGITRVVHGGVRLRGAHRAVAWRGCTRNAQCA